MLRIISMFYTITGSLFTYILDSLYYSYKWKYIERPSEIANCSSDLIYLDVFFEFLKSDKNFLLSEAQSMNHSVTPSPTHYKKS
jgi:hypothetical protein